MVDKSYLGVSQNPTVAGSFLLRVGAADDAQADIWINRSPSISQSITDVSDKALIASGWQQVVAQFDAGVTRQHKH
jgi:hypothetical protein